MILHEFKHDIALRRIGVKALIALSIVLLIEDNLVLSLSNSQVVGSTVHTEGVGLQAPGDAAFGQRIGMDRDKQVGLITVGYVGTGVQGDERVGLTGIDNLDVRTVLLYQTTKGQCHIQIDNLLFGQ